MPQLAIYIFICIGHKRKVLLLTSCCQQMSCIYQTKSDGVTSWVLINSRSLLLTSCCQQMFFVYIRLNLMGSRHEFLFITELLAVRLPIKTERTPRDVARLYDIFTVSHIIGQSEMIER